MKPKKYRLMVVAHPDDETIFFAGALLTKRDLPWHVICLTDGNADGRGKEREREFRAATELLGAKSTEHWAYPDIFPARLPVTEIAERIRGLPSPFEIFTHGPMGEYGHPHHQDACLSVHRAFGEKVKIYSPAWNCNADFVIKLTGAQFKKKTFAFSEIYFKETSRFLNILPNMPVEGYKRHLPAEVEAIVSYFRREKSLNAKAMKETSWAAKMLPDLREKLDTRLF